MNALTLSDLPADLLAARPHLFSAASVPIAADDLARMRELVAAVECVVAMPQWAEFTHTRKVPPAASNKSGFANEIADLCRRVVDADDTLSGAFMGYDFHLTPQGPQLIEINTNAGGGLLAALQAGRDDVLAAYVAMFRAEYGAGELKTLAIVDEAPETQYLYPEFLGFRQLFAAQGIEAVICAPEALMLCHGNLWYEEMKIDLVYNRLTDFAFAAPAQAVLREAWRQGARITPNPDIYARYADKKNLVALSDAALLESWGVDAATRAVLRAVIPQTEQVVAERADDFWQRRRELFFKPAAGFGSKGSYRGDKLTKRVFEEILAGDYVAQAFAPPSQVEVMVDNVPTPLKADVRNYVYRGEVQLVAARLYQGQTTNFRTPGGGFARVIGA